MDAGERAHVSRERPMHILRARNVGTRPDQAAGGARGTLFVNAERPIDGVAWAHALRSARVRRAGQKKRIENFLALAVGEVTKSPSKRPCKARLVTSSLHDRLRT